MGLPEIGDDEDLPKLSLLFMLSVALPALVWALLRTDSHLAGTRRRWRLLTFGLWMFGLALSALGFSTVVRGGPS